MTITRPAIFAVVVLTALAGCAAQPTALTDDSTAVRLVDTKSPVQLLRNEVATRIPADLIERVDDSQDRSLACSVPDEDPEGLLRSWHSSLRATLTSESADGVDDIVDDLVASFTDQGWSAQAANRNEASDAVRLTSDDSIASIEIDAEQDSGTTAVIQIDTYGPCVTTDGKDSAEVRTLEGD